MNPSRKPTAAMAALLSVAAVLLASSAPSVVADASASASCSPGDEGFSSGTCGEAPVDPTLNTPSGAKDAAVDRDSYHAHCAVWPTEGVPFEHTDGACDRDRQNRVWQRDDAVAQSTPKAQQIPDTVYLNMPEEKTWVCPLEGTGVHAPAGGAKMLNDNNSGDNNDEDVYTGTTGHPTRWVMYNRASNPVILTHVNHLGLEVSANDHGTFPAHSNTAVYPHGPVVLPGHMAVVEGRQGHMFMVREYNEVLPMNIDHDAPLGNLEPSWKSFSSVLPKTGSGFLPQQSRFETGKRVMHVLGSPGRVLMKHRMGNIYVRNQFGAMCPEGGSGGIAGRPKENKVDGRKGNPKDLNPDCNVLRKALINKVGCPVDLYWAPRNREANDTYNCEKFTNHLEPLEPFLASDPATRDVDGPETPLKFENTYNSHNFVARMAHDNSLVARIELDHDVVRDCPDPEKINLGVEVTVEESILQGVTVDAMANATGKSSWASAVAINATVSAPIRPRKLRKQKDRLKAPDDDALWQNRTGSILSAAMPVAS